MAGSGKLFPVDQPARHFQRIAHDGRGGHSSHHSRFGFRDNAGYWQIWLGSTYGTVVSWSDMQVVATVALSSKSGNAQVLQGNVSCRDTSSVPKPTRTSSLSLPWRGDYYARLWTRAPIPNFLRITLVLTKSSSSCEWRKTGFRIFGRIVMPMSSRLRGRASSASCCP